MPEILAAAWDYVDRSPEVEAFWVNYTYEDRASVVDVLYRVGGEIYRPQFVLPALGMDEATDDEESDFLFGIEDLFDPVKASEGPFPTRTILRYTTATQAFDGDFSYSPLQPQATDDNRWADNEIGDFWEQRLRETGEDSAEFVPPPPPTDRG